MIPRENSRSIRSDKMAVLNENGLNLRKRPYLETRSFYQKMSIHQKGLFIVFDLSESSHDFSFISWFVFSG